MTDHATDAPPAPPRGRRPLLILVPLLLFGAMAVMFAFALIKGDPAKLPSALIGKSAPALSLTAIEGLDNGGRAVPLLTPDLLRKGEVTVVNFWASWCGPCIEEHPLLTELARTVPVVGVNYKDAATNARRFLSRHGNPFAAIGADTTGRTAIEWGVYGMPETFIIDRAGRIAYKHVGPISRDALNRALLPTIARLKAEKPKS